MKYNKKATVLVYILVLVNLSLIMGLIITSNTYKLTVNYEINKINRQLLYNIVSKGKLIIKHLNRVNNDGGGFTDNIACPDPITMSGTNFRNPAINSQITYSGGIIYCNGTYNSQDLKIYFNSDIDDFYSARLGNSIVTLNAGANKVGATTFGDADNTLISFLSSSYLKTDGIDDDFNSDNYSIGSSGTITYPNDYIDNDADFLKVTYGYVSPDSEYYNIFWMNSKIGKYIEENNTYNLLANPLSSSGYLYFDFDNPYSLKLLKFDKNQYNSTKEFILLDKKEATSSYGSLGYLQDDLTLTGNISPAAYEFDFQNYDYAMFLKNTGTGVLFFNLWGETLTGSGLILNPVNNSGSSVIEVLSNHLMEIDEGKYLGKISEIVGKRE